MYTLSETQKWNLCLTEKWTIQSFLWDRIINGNNEELSIEKENTIFLEYIAKIYK